MAVAKKIADFMSASVASIASIGKMILLSKWKVPVPAVEPDQELVILGNGPSLNDTVRDSLDFLIHRQRLAVNFAANTELFFSLKPQYYVLADPHFFQRREDVNVVKLWNAISSVDWDITLFIPGNTDASSLPVSNNPHVRVCHFNMTPVEGYHWLENWAYATGLGSPRPRNVLIPSLMAALRMKFKTIYLAGADHSWSKTLSVDDENHVVSIQPHFYKDNKNETTRIATDYIAFPLHSIYYSFYLAFKSYFNISRFATRIGATIWNITPGSFIDAFPRKKV